MYSKVTIILQANLLLAGTKAPCIHDISLLCCYIRIHGPISLLPHCHQVCGSIYFLRQRHARFVVQLVFSTRDTALFPFLLTATSDSMSYLVYFNPVPLAKAQVRFPLSNTSLGSVFLLECSCSHSDLSDIHPRNKQVLRR